MQIYANSPLAANRVRVLMPPPNPYKRPDGKLNRGSLLVVSHKIIGGICVCGGCRNMRYFAALDHRKLQKPESNAFVEVPIPGWEFSNEYLSEK